MSGFERVSVSFVLSYFSLSSNLYESRAHHCYLALACGADLLVGFAGCGIMVISSLIFKGLRSESLDLEDGEEGALLFLSITRFATTLWAEYTWFSNCLYIPNVAVQTVHLYDRCAGFKVMPWSRAT